MNGILNVYKEKGFTSFDVVAKLRGILHKKKIGHTGTLDPDAIGVLPVCVGKATKVCDLLTDKDKVYTAVVKLGVTTDTLDLTGEVLNKCEVKVTKEDLYAVLPQFTGEISQIPPMYSAIKINGKKLYELARKGQVVERKARNVTIHSLNVTEIHLENNEFTMEVHCSKGTYIRSLCQDIGDVLGCGAAMKSLVRNRVGEFVLEKAMTLSQIAEFCDKNEPEELLLPIDMVFQQFPVCHVAETGMKALTNGNFVGLEYCDYVAEQAETVRMYDENNDFYALYEYIEKEKRYRIIKMFHE